MILKLKSMSEFHEIDHVQYAIRPSYDPPSCETSAQPISAENARHIASVAKYIEDEPLRKALLKLSEAKPRSN